MPCTRNAEADGRGVASKALALSMLLLLVGLPLQPSCRRACGRLCSLDFAVVDDLHHLSSATERPPLNLLIGLLKDRRYTVVIVNYSSKTPLIYTPAVTSLITWVTATHRLVQDKTTTVGDT